MNASPHNAKPRWRMRLTLSAVYLALFCISTGLQGWVATHPAMAAAAPWLGVTSAITAIVAFISASKFRSSIELGRALGSPVLNELSGNMPAIEGVTRKPAPPIIAPAVLQAVLLDHRSLLPAAQASPTLLVAH